jgi:hypothetical protein
MRSLEEIRTDYYKTCAQLGEAIHNTEVEMKKNFEKAQSDMKNMINSLHQKVASLKKEDSEVEAASKDKAPAPEQEEVKADVQA